MGAPVLPDEKSPNDDNHDPPFHGARQARRSTRPETGSSAPEATLVASVAPPGEFLPENRTHDLLAEHRAALDAVIATLLERETISGEELATIVRPFRQVDHTRDPVPTLAMTNNDARSGSSRTEGAVP